VRVSGVQIGTLSAVKLQNGYAIVKMNLDKKYSHVIHKDATAFLRPKTGLQDMFIELNPGDPPSPVVNPGYTIPLAQTAPEVNVDEILSSLDTDTRAYLQLLVNGAGQGLNNRGGELAQVLERFEPTHRDLARLNQAVAARGADLQHLVTSLRRLNDALVTQTAQIGSLIVSSSKVFRATASVNGQISQTIADLPATLQQARTTLGKVQTFASLLGPTATKLLPAAHALPAANHALTELAGPTAVTCGSLSTCSVIKNQIQPFVAAARPLVRHLRPASINLAKATPNLRGSFSVVNKFLNILGYNPPSPQHGYLWWLAWLGHIGRTVFAVQDGNGDFRQAFIQLSCATINQLTNQVPGGATILLGLNLTTILSNANLCPAQAPAVQSQFRNFQSGGTSSPYSTANPTVAARLRKAGVGNIGNQFLPNVRGH
jgi:phospholipid/cholesterol/gamma-HCH transport system substrate-binding protein